MKIGTIYDITFSTNRADTGALANADSTPIVRVTENGTNLAYTPTVTSLTTGVYLVSIDASLANGFEVGKRYSVYVTATVNGIDGANGLDSFTVEARSIDDVLPTASYTTPPTASSIRAEIDANSTKLDVSVSSRLASAGYTAPPTVGAIRTELTPELGLISLNLDAKVSEAGGGGGLTTEQATQLSEVHANVDIKSSDIRAGGGGGFSSQAIQTSLGNAKREIIEQIKEIPQVSLEKVETQLSEIKDSVNEIDSHITLAKEETIDTIKASENEICSDIIRKSKELKEDNVKTRNLVRQKSEKVVKYAEKQLDMQEQIEKEIEDTENEIKEEFDRIEADEKEIADLFDQYDKDEEEIKAEFDKLESNT